MQITAKGAQKTREESKKLSMYSKQWSPGDTLRVFYPIVRNDSGWDIIVGAVWGHSVGDIKALGLKTAFIPSLTAFDDDAQPIGSPDITYQFSQIAKAFVDGQKISEEAAIMQKNWPDEAPRKEALKALEDKFDTKNNMKAVKPIIGRATYYISTEVITVKYVNDAPQLDTLAIVSCPLSNQNIDRLYAIMNDSKYAPQEGDRFLEVEWKYPVNTDKSASAKSAAPSGLTAEYRMAVQYPSQYNTVATMFDMVSTDSDTIARRATRKVDEAKIRKALTQYSFINSNYLDACGTESVEALVKHADLIKELDVTRAINNMELVEKINASFEQIVAATPEAMPDLSNIAASAVNASVSTETMPDLTVVPGAPNVQDLLHGAGNANLTEDQVSDINLDAL